MTVDRAAPSVIRTRGLRKTYAGRGVAVEAVKGVDLSVEAGEIFGFLGPNGAGKTTTLRMLATLIAPTSGDATVAGADLLREPGQVRARIGYVAQGGGSDPQMTGRGELVIQGRLFGMSRKEAEARASEVLAAFDLTEAAARTTGTYSGGMRRRLDIGLGIVHKPALLFLDEPTTGLDPQARAHLWDEVRKLRAGGTTVFLTTHYLEEADALCDRVAIIDHGTIVAEGTPNDLKRAIEGDVIALGVDDRAHALPLVRAEAYVREANEGDSDDVIRVYVDDGAQALPQLLRLLDGAGLTAQTITLTRPSLDSVFLRKTGRSLRDHAA